MAHLEVEPKPKRPLWIWILIVLILLLLAFLLFRKFSAEKPDVESVSKADTIQAGTAITPIATAAISGANKTTLFQS